MGKPVDEDLKKAFAWIEAEITFQQIYGSANDDVFLIDAQHAKKVMRRLAEEAGYELPADA